MPKRKKYKKQQHLQESNNSILHSERVTMEQPSTYVSTSGMVSYAYLPNINRNLAKKHIKSQAVIKRAAMQPQQINIATTPSNCSTVLDRDQSSTLKFVLDQHLATKKNQQQANTKTRSSKMAHYSLDQASAT